MTTDTNTPTTTIQDDEARTSGTATGTGAAAPDGGTETGSQRLPVDVPAGSRLARLKEQRDERLKKEELKLPVPTWRGDLVAVFRPMGIEERKEFSARMSADNANFDEVTIGAEFVASCCTGLLERDEKGSLVPCLLSDGRPAKIDAAFAHELGYTAVTTPAGCLQQLVNWNVAAVEGLFEKLQKWSEDTSMFVEGAILGE